MKNFEKYEEEIKKLNYSFGFNPKTKQIFECYNCSHCLFYDHEEGFCLNNEIVKWLYEEYNPKTQLTIKEIEELLKDKYPNGIEVVK